VLGPADRKVLRRLRKSGTGKVRERVRRVVPSTRTVEDSSKLRGQHRKSSCRWGHSRTHARNNHKTASAILLINRIVGDKVQVTPLTKQKEEVLVLSANTD